MNNINISIWARSEKTLLILLASIYWGESNAQEHFSDNLYASANYHYGYMIPEYSNITYLVEKPIQSASITLSKRTTGTTDWEQIYKRPAYGVSLFYSTLGNNAVHGHEFSLFPYFNLSITEGAKFRLYNETGIGLSYVTKKFDLNNNYLNVTVGSHFNLHFNMKFGLQYRLLQNISIKAGTSFDHFSNGNFGEPNLGLNYLTAFVGVDYLLGRTAQSEKHELTPHHREFYFEGIYSAGSKHARALDSKTYFTSSATLEIKWRANRTINFGLGADLFFDTSTKIEMEALNRTGFSEKDNFKTGIHASQEFIYNRFSIIIQEGVYVLLTDKIKNRVMYNRGIMRYRATDHLFVQIAMKSHLNILDYPELGLGWRWK